MKFLINEGANPSIKSQLTDKCFENPLDVASRWGFVDIMKYLVENVKWSRAELCKAKQVSGNREVKSILSKNIKSMKGGSCCFPNCKSVRK